MNGNATMDIKDTGTIILVSGSLRVGFFCTSGCDHDLVCSALLLRFYFLAIFPLCVLITVTTTTKGM